MAITLWRCNWGLGNLISTLVMHQDPKTTLSHKSLQSAEGWWVSRVNLILGLMMNPSREWRKKQISENCGLLLVEQRWNQIGQRIGKLLDPANQSFVTIGQFSSEWLGWAHAPARLVCTQQKSGLDSTALQLPKLLFCTEWSMKCSARCIKVSLPNHFSFQLRFLLIFPFMASSSVSFSWLLSTLIVTRSIS
jgi:hypothetical protein